MIEFDEQTALAIVFANTRRKRREVDLLTIGRAFDYLASLYGSITKVSDRVDLSPEMIRQFITVLRLQKEVQKLVVRRKIDRVDMVKELAAIREPAKQIAVAREAVASDTKDLRDIRRLVKAGRSTAKDAKATILQNKPQQLHVFVVDVDGAIYHALDEQAKTRGVATAELVRDIVTEWVTRVQKRRSTKRG